MILNKNKLLKNAIVCLIVTLFIASSVAPITNGNNSTDPETENMEILYQHILFDCYSNFNSSNALDEKTFQDVYLATISSEGINHTSAQSCVPNIQANDFSDSCSGIIDSPWPMKCHDLHHTGRSPYSTADNDGTEIWRFETHDVVGSIEGSPVIGPDGTIYFGCFDCHLYALYPDGTFKWKFKTDGWIWSAPAIAEDGTIYIGSYDDCLYALYPSGTLKWKFESGGSISSSPAIGADGTIYFGTLRGFDKGDIFAVNPNGTEKWHYTTDYYITSDPAIGDDGTIYIGSGDTYFYAMNPDGTLKWRFKTGGYIKGPPSVANDGTVYICSYDDFLYALNPDGTSKWKCNIGHGSETNPSIAADGTIYVGGNRLYAINPNGLMKWSFDLGTGGHIHQSSPAISLEGKIFVGLKIDDMSGGEIIAVNSDGTEQWRKKIANKWVESSPCIDRDGTVYIGSSLDDEGYSYGILYAFGAGELKTDANGPYYGLVNEPVGFTGYATGGHKPYSWKWSFGDNSVSYEKNPTHIYGSPGNYTVTLTVTDDDGNTSTDTTWAWIQETNNPPNKPVLKGPSKGKPGQYYDYSFSAIDPENNNVFYYVDWGDGEKKDWFGPYASGHEETLSHSWNSRGTYTVRIKAKDVYGNESEWSSLEVKMPKSIPFNSLWQILSHLIDRFPLLAYLFNY
jgi:outer membrane protein assembly factor BamB